MLPNFTYVRPTSLSDAIRQLAASGARVHAGGSDLLGCLRDGVFSAEKLVSLSGIASLRGIAATPAGGLRIGALATLSEIAVHPLVLERAPALAQAAAAAASPQLRNQGTIGGNLCQRPRCWYFRGDFHCLRKGGDTCFALGGENQYHAIFGASACCIVHPSDTAPALVALNAEVRIAGPAGERVVPVASFFVLPDKDVQHENVLQPNEIVTEVAVPPPPAGLTSSYRKVRGRGAWDFALAGLASAVVMAAGKVASARLVLGGVAPVPWRAEAAEQAIVGKRLEAKVIALAATAAVSGAEPLAHNAYKIPLVKGIVTEALTGLLPLPAAGRKEPDDDLA